MQAVQAPEPQKTEKLKGAKLEGGTIVEDLTVGSGPKAKAGKMVGVYYVGRLAQNNKVRMSVCALWLVSDIIGAYHVGLLVIWAWPGGRGYQHSLRRSRRFSMHAKMASRSSSASQRERLSRAGMSA